MSTAAAIAFTLWLASIAGLVALILWDATRPLAGL